MAGTAEAGGSRRWRQAVFQRLQDNKQFHMTYHDSRGCGAVVCERHVGD
ncbi:hypothetical protein G3N96_30465 [Burkholderia sp. Se-20373]|nr:hypothetical protein [Burkholderia sp. Se-20373]MBN3749716.1 hypothetical protein [Burkholderia sp. Se-20373]